uniref:Retrovirus-related Pol polyprotein from transposon TNT 1-94 n=1 Tax=Quercus lobata TaxID=97700 RepID=A0A7N2L6B7_QUELO
MDELWTWGFIYDTIRNHMSKVPYASTIGSLMYAMVCTRPDIAHAVGVVSRFMTISWASNLQKIVTLSTTEAEYVATIESEKEMIWLHGFLDELDKLVILEKICGSKNPANMLTKGVTIEKLKLRAVSVGLLA